MTTLVLAPIGFMAMFTGFAAYDDEGYFLVVLKDYLGGQPLLNSAVPVYGPFFFETMGGVFKLFGLAPGHDAGRWVTLVVWLAAAVLSGLTAIRLTRNLGLGVAAELITFLVLLLLTREPMSPSALVALLMVGMSGAATFGSTRPRVAAVLVGAITVALCLVKINVGGLAVIAVAFAWACGLEVRWRRWVLPLMSGVAVLVPVALMAGLFRLGWVVVFAIGSALAVAGVGVAALSHSPPSSTSPPARWIVGSGLVLALVCLGIAFAGGTRPQDVWNGLVVVSFRFPGLFVAPLPLNPAYDVWAAACFGLAVVFARRPLSPRVMGRSRVAIGASAWLCVLLFPTLTFLFALPLVWLAVIPAAHDREDLAGYARRLLPAFAVLESLQVYPVAGTQMSLAALSLVPVGAICLSDGFETLGALGTAPGVSRWVTVASVVLAVQVLLLKGFFIEGSYVEATPLGLPGASSVKLPSTQATQLRALASAIDARCSAFITLPGMNSLYLWTRQAPPTDVRSEIWMLTFDSAQQASLVAQLENRPGLCAVRNRRQIDFWSGGHSIPERPLVEFIDQGFTSAGTFGDYELLVRK